jgi:hypothetical protein
MSKRGRAGASLCPASTVAKRRHDVRTLNRKIHERSRARRAGPSMRARLSSPRRRPSRRCCFPMCCSCVWFLNSKLTSFFTPGEPWPPRPGRALSATSRAGVYRVAPNLGGRRDGKDDQVGRVSLERGGSRLDHLLSVLTIGQAPDAACAECARPPAGASALPLTKRSSCPRPRTRSSALTNPSLSSCPPPEIRGGGSAVR